MVGGSLHVEVRCASAESMLPLRTRHRQEMNSQIVHDSIHRRAGWTLSYFLLLDGATVGFASVAIGGPWTGKPTLFEFYVLPEHRTRAFDLFEELLRVGAPSFFEAQSNEVLVTILVQAYGREIMSEKIVFQDHLTTKHQVAGARLKPLTAPEELQRALEARQGGGEWALELEGAEAGKGGILFHYNRPYGDIYMEVAEPFRRRGLGTYLVQELKDQCYQLGAVPCARCSPDNVASRKTLVRAGFAPCAHILVGRFN